MHNKLANIPCNLVMGFLGVGKTTAILGLLKQKPKNENWAELVNEFGQIGIEGAIYSAASVTVKEIAGGCLCCAVGLPFQVSINRLLKEVRPDRLLIEPTGLGHPKKVLDILLTGGFKEILQLRASICLVDPEKIKWIWQRVKLLAYFISWLIIATRKNLNCTNHTRAAGCNLVRYTKKPKKTSSISVCVN
ncbi:MAG: GTP-binding protein [Methylococcales bacterium]